MSNDKATPSDIHRGPESAYFAICDHFESKGWMFVQGARNDWPQEVVLTVVNPCSVVHQLEHLLTVSMTSSEVILLREWNRERWHYERNLI